MPEGIASVVAPTPACSDLAILRTSVARYVQMPDHSECLAVAVDGMNEAIRELNLRAWNFLKTYQDIVLAANTVDYTISADYRDSRHAELLDSSGIVRSRLIFHDPKNFDRTFADRSSGGT